MTSLEENGIEVNVTLPPRKGVQKSTPSKTTTKPPAVFDCPGSEDVKSEAIPPEFDLSNNYPNPFNPSTTIQYALPEASHVTIKASNTLGQEVRTFVDEHEPAEYNSVVWDGKNNPRMTVSGDTYVYRITAVDFVRSAKMYLRSEDQHEVVLSPICRATSSFEDQGKEEQL